MRKRYKFFESKKVMQYITINPIFKNLYIKYLIKNLLIPVNYRQCALLILLKFNKKINFFTTLNYICLETGKTRLILLNFKVSGLVLKTLLEQCVVNGVYKYSW